MSIAENTIHPLQIQDARSAAFEASNLQKGVEDRIKKHSRELAEAERQYRQKLSTRMLELHAGGLAITTCETVAKGEKPVADLRYKRDVAKGVLESSKQEAFRRGADRKDIDTLLNWSMRRDLRTDAPPGERDNVETFGGRRAA